MGAANVGFALPSTTSHLHNGHTASESDGNPQDWIDPGEFWDHHYGNFPACHDPAEKLTTLWYHDHRLDFTAANVYAGLAGFYLLFDEEDTGDENDPRRGAWRLPSGRYDVPSSSTTSPSRRTARCAGTPSTPTASSAWLRDLARGGPVDVALWLRTADLARLPEYPGAVRRLYLSSTLLQEELPSLAALPAPWRERLRLTWPRSLPGTEGPHVHRARAWLQARGLPPAAPADEPLQLDAWYSLSLADHALTHMAERFSRELLLEEIEREAEREPNPGVYPRLSLGPGQRYASQGCYLVRLAPDGIVAEGEWTVP